MTRATCHITDEWISYDPTDCPDDERQPVDCVACNRTMYRNPETEDVEDDDGNPMKGYREIDGKDYCGENCWPEGEE